MRIRDPGWRQFGSGIRDGKKSDPELGINIQDPQHCTVWLLMLFFNFLQIFNVTKSVSIVVHLDMGSLPMLGGGEVSIRTTGVKA
jgi:hypothetical protein